MTELGLYLMVICWTYVRYYHLLDPEKEQERLFVPPGPDFASYDKLLEEKLTYYRDLNRNGRYRFYERLRLVEDQMNIEGAGDFVVGDRERILLCASVTQLTFGFDEPVIPFIKNVVVFSDIFHSRLIGKDVKGLSLFNGAVWISWPHFEEGYLDSEDTYNLGLHEFAHMLRFEALKAHSFDPRLDNYFARWEEIGNTEFYNMRNGSIDFFREYAATNESEFFSVCIENFFEVPHKFEKRLPALYYHLCYLLRQNPLNKSANYIFERDEVTSANKTLRYKLPVYEFIFFHRERLLWNKMQMLLLFIFALVVISFSHDTYHLIYFIRLSLVAALLIFCMRWSYYRTYKAVSSSSYLGHFFFRIVPFTALFVSLMISLFG